MADHSCTCYWHRDRTAPMNGRRLGDLTPTASLYDSLAGGARGSQSAKPAATRSTVTPHADPDPNPYADPHTSPTPPDAPANPTADTHADRANAEADGATDAHPDAAANTDPVRASVAGDGGSGGGTPQGGADCSAGIGRSPTPSELQADTVRDCRRGRRMPTGLADPAPRVQ